MVEQHDQIGLFDVRASAVERMQELGEGLRARYLCGQVVEGLTFLHTHRFGAASGDVGLLEEKGHRAKVTCAQEVEE